MKLERLPLQLKNDQKRVILQFFNLGNIDRINRIIKSVEALSEERINELLSEVYTDYENRHKDFKYLLIENFKKIEKHISNPEKYSNPRKELTGAYFSKEYSIEASALFNPSIVPHPNQTGLKEGELRFIVSLRATGEGHVSSIEFRSGKISKQNEVYLDNASKYCVLPYEQKQYNNQEVKAIIKNEKYDDEKTADILSANYSMRYDNNSEISERVIFPYSALETVGMEDARFVKFVSDDGGIKYCGTYTAYNGRSYQTQLIETKDFINFDVRTMHGKGVRDKGMALFPKKINGKYAMISREDSESIFMLYSDSLYNWGEAIKIMTPQREWEFIQLGNCGSPIETDKGWLLITHGVGPMRKYVVSACLLDKGDPTKIIGSLKNPLISPNEEEREGYVPNVVYSCGALIHNNELIMPYAMSDSSCGFAKIPIDELLSEML